MWYGELMQARRARFDGPGPPNPVAGVPVSHLFGLKAALKLS